MYVEGNEMRTTKENHNRSNYSARPNVEGRNRTEAEYVVFGRSRMPKPNFGATLAEILFCHLFKGA